MHFSYKSGNTSASKQRKTLLISSSEKLKFLSAGTGIVYGIDDKRVLKQYEDSSEGDVERQAYELLGSHPNIAKYLGSREDGSIILERGQLLRTICRQTATDQIPLHRKLRWLRQWAEGIKHIHDTNIIHSDIGTHNTILIRGDRLKVIDFEGASINGGEPASLYEWFSYRSSRPEASKQTDIFAFGCAVYEIITGRPPYHELETSENRAYRVEQLYQENRFPDVAYLPLGDFMQNCWHNAFNSMSEVIQALEAASRSSLKAKFRAPTTGILKSSCCLT